MIYIFRIHKCYASGLKDRLPFSPKCSKYNFITIRTTIKHNTLFYYTMEMFMT